MDRPISIPPPIGSGHTPELHCLPGLKFQALCRDLLESGGDSWVYSCREYGINGQRQHGADLLVDRKGGGIDVFQCKAQKTFPPAQIKLASNEFLKHIALWKSRDIRRFIVLVGTEVSTTQQLNEIARQRDDFRDQHGIEYELWPSTTIVNKLRMCPGVVSQHLDPSWVQIICGPNHDSPLKAEVDTWATRYSQLACELGEARDESLSAIREYWRQGRRQEARRRLAATKSETAKWSDLPPAIRASYLRFESAIELDSVNGDILVAERLLNEAQDLSPAPDDARLRAAILWRLGDVSEALFVLDLADTDRLRNFKAFLLLTLQRHDEAKSLLDLVVEENAETFQLRSLCSLAEGRLGEARLSIQKAIEKSPLWTNVQATSAILDFLSTTVLSTPPRFLPPWPEPVHFTYVLHDDEARQRRNHALASFENILTSTELDEDERQCMEVWKVACLALDPDKRLRFESEVSRILLACPTQHRVLAWAIIMGLKTLCEVPSEMIRQLVADGKASLEQILVLTQFYTVNNNSKKAERLLRKTKALFESAHSLGVWSSWMAQILARLGRDKQALALLDSSPLSTDEARLVKSRLLLSSPDRNDREAQRYLLDSYNLTSDRRFLLDYVELSASAGEWTVAVEHCDELFRLIPTVEVLRITTYCAYRAGSYSLCLKLLDHGSRFYSTSPMPSEMRRLRAHCQLELGLVPAGLREAERLAEEEPTLEHLTALSGAYLTVGDLRRLSFVAKRILSLGNAPTVMLLRLAGQIRWENRPLAVDLWLKANELGFSEADVVPALQMASELGLDDKIGDLMERLHELGSSAQGHVRIASLDEFKAEFRAAAEQSQQANIAYQQARVPIHAIAPRVGISLASLYHHQLTANSKASMLWDQPLVFTRAGCRALRPLDHIGKQDLKLFADVTAILFAHHFGFLESVEEAFSPIFIPPSLIPSLVLMRDQLTQGQVRRFSEYRRILNARQRGKLSAVKKREASRTDLPESLHLDWIAWVEEALRQNGFVVDLLPLATEHREVKTSELPKDVQGVLVGVKDLLAGLADCGGITADQFKDLARSPALVTQPRVREIEAGAKIFLTGSAIELLATFGLLDTLAEFYAVWAEEGDLDRLQSELDAYERREDLARWVAELITRLHDGLMAGRFIRISAETVEPNAESEQRTPRDPATDCLVTLIRSHSDSTARAWIDERFANMQPMVGKVSVIDSIELLQQLFAHGRLKATDYYSILSRIRAEGASFVPVLKDEILNHLLPAERGERELAETTGLRNLRRGASAAFLAGRFLQPIVISGETVDRGENEFLARSMSGISEALVELWRQANLTSSDRIQKSDWIVRRLFVPNHALRNIVGLGKDNEDRYAFALALASLLCRTIGFSARKSDRKSARQFNDWIYRSLLRRPFSADPELIELTAAYLREMIGEVWPKDLSDRESEAATLLMQNYYMCLPTPIRAQMGRNPDFLKRIGLRIEARIKVLGLPFERSAYLTAAREAINGRQGSAMVLQTGAIARFLPASRGDCIKIEHGSLQKATIVRDWRFGLLAESPSRRGNALSAAKYLLDVPTWSRDDLAEVAATEDYLLRIEKAESLAGVSLVHFLAQLTAKIQKKGRLTMQEFLPEDLAALPRYLRLDTVKGPAPDWLQLSCADLMESIGLRHTLDRVFRIPVDLPEQLIDAVRALSSLEKQLLAGSLLSTNTSPLWRIQFARMLHSCFDDDEQLLCAWHSDASEPENKAYLGIVRWVFDELLGRNSRLEWPPAVLLSTAWACGDLLFCLLHSQGLDVPEILARFSFSSSRIVTSFESNGLLSQDVANPHNSGVGELLICGLADIPSLGERLKALCRFSVENDMVPQLSLIPEVAHRPNHLSSFLGRDRLALFCSLSRNDDSSDPETLRTAMEEQALSLLDSDDNRGWIMLRSVVGTEFVPTRITEKVERALIRWNFVRFGASESLDTVAQMFLVSTTLLPPASGDLVKARFRTQLIQLTEEINRQRSGDSRELTAILLEAALNLARCCPTKIDRVSAFTEIVSDLAKAWPRLGPIARPIIQEICDGPFIGQSTELWRLNLKLRTQ